MVPSPILAHAKLQTTVIELDEFNEWDQEMKATLHPDDNLPNNVKEERFQVCQEIIQNVVRCLLG